MAKSKFAEKNPYLLLEKNKKQFIDDFWLNLGDLTSQKFPNTIGSHELFQENPALAILDIMRKPENFAFTAKTLFNFEVHPLQAVVLQMLWNHPFSLFSATRGGSKSTLLALYGLYRAIFIPGSKILFIGNAFRQSKIIFSYCENIWRNAPILRDILSVNHNNKIIHATDMYRFFIEDSTISAIPLGDGCLSPYTAITYSDCIGQSDSYHSDKTSQINYVNREIYSNGIFQKSTESYFNGIKELFRIQTDKGYYLDCTLNHKIKVLRNNEIIWSKLSDLNQLTDKILIDKGVRWHSGITDLSVDDGYFCGLMIGDGSWTNKYRLQFTSCDKESVDFVKQRYPNLFGNDGVHYFINGMQNHKDFINKFNLCDLCYTINKIIPNKILNSSKDVVKACLQGLFDTDGTLQVSTVKGGVSVYISFCNTSQKLVEQIQFLLLHFGIISKLTHRKRGDKWNMIYELNITGRNAKIFAKEIGFRLTRKQLKLEKAIEQQCRNISNDDRLYGIINILYSLCKKYKIVSKFKIRGRKEISKYAAAEIYNELKDKEDLSWLKELLQEHLYFDTIKSIGSIGKSECYDLCVNDTHEYTANGFIVHNSKIRGERSSCTISDEYNTLNEDIYQEVVQGFSSVALNPIEKIKEKARYKAMMELGDLSTQEFQEIRDARVGNQQIISGTCGYTFEPMYKVWKQYHDIIMSRGDQSKIDRIFNGETPLGFSYKDYAIARLPYELFPEDYMDEKVLGRAKATTHMSIYNSEYRCIFISDSDGFFRRTLIEQATAMNQKPPLSRNSCGIVDFIPTLRGQKDKRYVMAIDPASERDNFSIIILEIWPDHRRICYCWAVNKDTHRTKLKYGLTKEHDYYSFCCAKVRELMKAFNIEFIAIDAQGGGIPIMEKLGDPATLKDGELPLYPIEEEGIDKVTDALPGRHIIHVIQFSKAEWVATANHSLKLDFEVGELIFPMKDSLAFGLAREEDEIFKRRKVDDDNPETELFYDTLEQCMLEIEELKDELVLIEHRKTPTGRDQWDTPEVKGVGHKKGRLRKDRYSALLMANMIGRTYINRLLEPEGMDYGGRITDFKKGDDGSDDYSIGFAINKRSGRRF